MSTPADQQSRPLSMVVSWRDRVELARALPSMLTALEAVGGDLNLVDFSGTQALLEAQLGEHAARVNVIGIEDERYFNKAAAQNLERPTAVARCCSSATATSCWSRMRCPPCSR